MLKIYVLMPGKTKSGKTLTENLRLVSGVPLDAPEPSHIEPRSSSTFYRKASFCMPVNGFCLYWPVFARCGRRYKTLIVGPPFW